MIPIHSPWLAAHGKLWYDDRWYRFAWIVWPQALAATGDDVLGDLVYQRHGALQAGPNDPVHRVEVRLYQRANLLQGHRTRAACFLGGLAQRHGPAS